MKPVSLKGARYNMLGENIACGIQEWQWKRASFHKKMESHYVWGGSMIVPILSFLGRDALPKRMQPKTPKEMASLRQELEAQEAFSRQESSLAKERMVLI